MGPDKPVLRSHERTAAEMRGGGVGVLTGIANAAAHIKSQAVGFGAGKAERCCLLCSRSRHPWDRPRDGQTHSLLRWSYSPPPNKLPLQQRGE